MSEKKTRDQATRDQAREAAEILEKRGMLEAAAQAYVRAGVPEEAARLLVRINRHEDAGNALWLTLGVEPHQIKGLTPDGKRQAFKAAICYGQAGRTQLAVDIFMGLGERTRAVELLQRTGDHAGAARLEGEIARSKQVVRPLGQMADAMTLDGARALEAAGKHEAAMEAYLHLRQLGHAARLAAGTGKLTQAAELYVEAGMAYEGAACYAQIGATGQCLDALQRVPRDHARYRDACVQAIRLATKLSSLDFELEHFLTQFVSTGPQRETELEPFLLLAKLYQDHDFVENAKDALQKLLAVAPGHPEAVRRLQGLESETRGSAMQYEKILKEEVSFRKGTEQAMRRSTPPPGALEGLPDLPDLPDLPGLPGMAPTHPTPPAYGYASTVPPTRTPAPVPAPLPSPPAPVVAAPPAPPPPPPPPSPPPAATRPVPEIAPQQIAGASSLAIGQIIAGRYRLDAKIGQGGMATVFRAHDQELDESVAIKIFTQPIEDETMLMRFKQELSLSRQLTHPNIIRLHDMGQHLGMRFITMELLSGKELRHYMKAKQPMDFRKALAYLVQACAGLQTAHDRGVIHRDVKPENFFITEGGILKVMDFGIAKKQSAPGMTVAGTIGGTPAYMSPEQISNFTAVSPATDLYALGVILYELLTGSVPFMNEEMMAVLVMHLTNEPEPPRKRNPAVPEHLEKIALKLLSKQPADRYPSCAELSTVLHEAADKLPRK